jgi:hypothetical protein
VIPKISFKLLNSIGSVKNAGEKIRTFFADLLGNGNQIN